MFFTVWCKTPCIFSNQPKWNMRGPNWKKKAQYFPTQQERGKNRAILTLHMLTEWLFVLSFPFQPPLRKWKINMLATVGETARPRNVCCGGAPQPAYRCVCKWAASVSNQWKLYAFAGIWYKVLRRSGMFRSSDHGELDWGTRCAPQALLLSALSNSHIFRLFGEMNWILVDLCNRINTDVGLGLYLERAPHGRWDGNFISKLSDLKEAPLNLFFFSFSAGTSQEIEDVSEQQHLSGVSQLTSFVGLKKSRVAHTRSIRSVWSV